MWNIAALADDERKISVAIGAFDHVLVTGKRKVRAGVARGASHHAAVAALDQHIGDRLAQLETLRDGVKVMLALAGGIRHEVGVGELRRGSQHRPGDSDRIIEGELADHPRLVSVAKGNIALKIGGFLRISSSDIA